MTQHPDNPKILLIGIQELLSVAVSTFLELGYEVLVFIPKAEWWIVERFKLDTLGPELFSFDTIDSDEAQERAAAFAPDYLLTIIFGERVPARMIALAKRFAMNLHPAALPDFRSGNPWFWPLRMGVSSSALTVHLLEHKWDSGDILYAHPFELSPIDNQGIYAERVRRHTQPCLLALDQVLRQSEVTLSPQPPSRYYPTIRLRDIVIDWDDTAASIACLVRACNPNHFAETVFRDLVVHVIEVTVTDRRRDTVFMPDGSVPAPGALNMHQHQLYCAASDFILRVDVVGVQDKIVGSGGRFAAIVGLRQGERFVNIASLPRFQHLLDK